MSRFWVDCAPVIIIIIIISSSSSASSSSSSTITPAPIADYDEN